MSMTDQIRDRLAEAFSPSHLDVVDDSERHRGHAGYQEGGESHFNVAITSTAFADMSRIAQHRAIHAALGEEIMSRIHALSLRVETNG